MEFLKNHKQITTQENKRLKKIAINQFLKEKEKGLTFEKAFKNVSNLITDEVRNENLIKKYSFHFGGLYDIYNRNLRDYDVNVDRVLKVLENEIYEKFKDPYVTSKKQNYSYDADYDEISSSYEKFTEQLLIYIANFDFDRALFKHYEYLKLIYEFDDISKIDLKPFEGEIVKTSKFINLYKKIKPNEPLPYEIRTLNALGAETTVLVNNFDKNSNKNIQNEIAIPVNKESFLSNIENALLINLFLQIMEENAFDEKAELYRVLSIIEVRPVDSFGTKASFRTSIEYKAMNGKLKNIDLINLKSNNTGLLKQYKQFLQKLSLKIEDFRLKKINKKIEEIQTKIDDILR